MKSHIALFKEYFPTNTSSLFSNSKAGNIFNHLNSAVSNHTTDMLDIESCRGIVNDVFDYFILKRKFTQLSMEVNGKLTFENDKFKIDNHEFQTLDEVERAVRNKAFL